MSQPTPDSKRSLPTSIVALLVVLGAGFFWAYWTTLADMAHRWWSDAQYSHGFLVPVFAAAVLWLRRGQLAIDKLRPNWWGLVLLAAGVGLRLGAAWYDLEWFDAMSSMPILAGFAVLLGGWAALAWCWPAIAFLFFMMPLPYAVETALAFPLRRLATTTSTYALQTVGFGALDEGTDIYLNDQRLQVAPACSGMGMLMIFFALSFAIAILIRRPLLDKILIVASAFPIAIASNIMRIFVTAVLFEVSTKEVAHKVFHDWAGFLMMPVGLGILWLELKFLDHLFTTTETRRVSPLAFNVADVGETNKPRSRRRGKR